MTRERLVVVGGDAAGMSAAHQALRTAARTRLDLEVVAFDQTSRTSYSACGIPYWLAGDLDDPEELVARSPQQRPDRPGGRGADQLGDRGQRCDLAAADLAYAPPFATVWEAVQLAARRLADRM